MILSNDIRTYLISVGVKNVYYSTLPDIDEGVGVFDSIGSANTWSLDSGIQIIARSKTRSTAHNSAIKVMQALHAKQLKLTNFHVTWSKAVSDIVPLGKDEKGRFEYSINFLMTRKSW